MTNFYIYFEVSGVSFPQRTEFKCTYKVMFSVVDCNDETFGYL